MSKLKVNNIEPLSGSVVTLLGGVNIEGTLTAREVRTELTQSVVLYQSGSTKLGDTVDDIHEITGSLFTSGTRVQFNVDWPEANNEYHILKTAPFTFNHGSNIRNYQYAAFNLDHFESGNQDLHHSMRMYMYDSHDTPSFGSELVVSPLDVKMQIIPSSSNGEGRTAKIEIRDEENGKTVAGVNANTIDLGSNWVDTQTVRLGNPSASVEVRGADYTHFGDMKISGSVQLGDSGDDVHQITGSLFTSGNVYAGTDLTVDGYTMLKKDQFLTGSLFTSGTRVEFNIDWPAAENEYHLIKTAPFTFNHGSNVRNYQYAAFNLDHFESGNQDLHHSMRLYMYDSHDTPSFGSELVVSPLDVKMQIIPSSSNGEGRTAKIEIRDEENGKTVAGVNANTIDLGSNWVDTQTVRLGNPSASVEVRGDNYTHFGDIKISGSIDNTYPSNKVRFFYPGEGDLPDPAIYHGMFAHVHATGKAYYSHQGGWVALAESASVDTRFAALELFSSSLDATYATDAELASVSGALSSTITTVSSSLTSISGALSTDIIANASAIAALDSTYATDAELVAVSGALATSITDAVTDLNAATSSYALASEVVANTVTGSFATTGSNVFTGNQVISASAVLTLEPSDPLPADAPTGSLAVSGSGATTKLYFYNGNSVSGWNEIAFV